MVCANIVSDSESINAKKVGNGIVFVGAKVVNSITDNNVFDLGQVQAPFGPGGTVIKVVGFCLLSQVGATGADF